MRNAFRLLVLLLVVSSSQLPMQAKPKPKPKAKHPKTQLGACTQGTPYRNCPACGSAKSLDGRNLDVLKNRDDPATDTKEITVQEMRDPANNDKFDPNRQV